MRFDLNPELQRNLWLQCSWQRLLAALVVGVTIAYALYSFGGFKRVFLGANLAILVAFGMWGPRRAADALAEEVGIGTWETQRMSGLSAWSMVWGKLVGGCAFVWYCGFLALACYIIAGHQLGYPPGRTGNFWLGVYLAVMGAALSHTTAFAVSLLLLRKVVFYRRLTITLAQTIGFFVYIVFSGVDSARVLEQTDPVLPVGTIGGDTLPLPAIGAILGTGLLIWALIAAFRLMRTELQYRAWPWAWAMFVAFCAFATANISAGPDGGMLATLAAVTVIMLLLCYASALADRRDPIRYRSGLLALRKGDFTRGLAELPWWLLSFVATLGAVGVLVATLITIPRDGLPDSMLDAMLRFEVFVSYDNLTESVLMVPLFMMRDILVLLCLSFGPWRHRADMTWLVYLALVYWPLGIILTFSGYFDFITLVLPLAGDNPLLNFGPILCQVLVAAWFVRMTWLQAIRSPGRGIALR